MAKKQKTSISAKLNYKTPVKSSKKAVEDIARMRNNERNKLNRLNTKFKATKKKGEADKLRREIKAQQKTLDKLQTSVKTVRKSNAAINQIKSETKSIRLKNAAIIRKIKALKGKNWNEATFKELNRQVDRNTNKINSNEVLIKEQLYSINKDFGIDPKKIADKLKFTKNYLRKNHEDDFDDEYFSELIEDLTGTGKKTTTEDAIAKEVVEEAEVGDGWDVEMHDTFWEVRKNFDTIENTSNGLNRYKKVIIEYGTNYHELSGQSIILIQQEMSAMWRWANDAGKSPPANTIKSISADETKLKYQTYIP